jgi:hypothetical protein
MLQHSCAMFDSAVRQRVDGAWQSLERQPALLGLGLGLGPTEVASEPVRGEVNDIGASVHVFQCYRRV